MQSRMDKYNTTDNTKVRSRTEKNRDLYEDVKNSSLKDFDVNSNMQVIDNGADIINVGRVRDILDRRYKEDAPKRRSIEIPEYEEIVEPEEILDTKEYDINAILNKAKQGKNVDYSKERLKIIRDTQQKILEDLDLELKNIEDRSENKKDSEAEQNLMNLINTITHIEKINKEKYSKEVSGAMDLLGFTDEEEVVDPDAEETESISIQHDEDETSDVTLELAEKEKTMRFETTEELSQTKEEHITETLSKLDIDMSSYDDFKDISKRDKSSIFIKIIIFIIILGLILGALYILNNVLGLGLFITH